LKKVVLILGTRPEAIKMAPLVKILKESPLLDVKVLVTAQHRQMMDSVLALFSITPDYDLDLMKPGQDLTDITAKVLHGCRDIFMKDRPDLVLVHGDTTTSMAGALAAFYQQIDVGHVEAGLRTFQKYSPFPEEINRQITTKIARFHFCPTKASQENVLREGISADLAPVTGNTVIDALLASREILKHTPLEKHNLAYVPSQRKFVLITGHRRENFGEGFLNICKAISSLAEKFPDMDFVYPVHLNPNVQKPVHEILSSKANVILLPPMDYLPFIHLMDKCHLILTDSGGVQEEAPSLGKPVLVMRSTTERPEAVEAGTVKLVGSDADQIIKNVSDLVLDQAQYDSMKRAINPYGDGKASGRIRKYIEEY
jgi:UDP-N-acetylglucosamine 2-epimerase (non-hydrolysing)